MSWIEKIKYSLIITTPDGKTYKPNWMAATKQTEWNVAEFDFIGKEGTLVKKSKKRGRRFTLELYFQGLDHLDIAQNFENSCNDERPITLQHPLYGTLIVQIPSILQDNTTYNVSRLQCTIIETIAESNPIVTQNAADQIPKLKEIADENLELTITQKPSATDTNRLKQSTKDIYAKGVPVISLPEEFEEYNNAFNTASTYVNTAAATPLLAIRSTISLINKPALFKTSVDSRVNLLIDQFNVLRNTVVNITSIAGKQLYQAQSNALISSMCIAAINPLQGNYTNNISVFKIIEKLTTNYGYFLEDLDFLQGLNGGNPANFIPDANSIIDLDNLFNMTISNLEQIALSARKERFIILEEDTNLILLTQRLYSLDPSDNNMNELMVNNNMGLNDILYLKKGTKIVYYI
jgi:hypothetical protein